MAITQVTIKLDGTKRCTGILCRVIFLAINMILAVIQDTQTLKVKNPNKQLENMPYMLGEADVNRQLQMLPGS